MCVNRESRLYRVSCRTTHACVRCTSLTVVSSDLREARGKNDEARADERTPKVPIPIIPREDYPHVCLCVVRTSCSPSWHIKASHSFFACTLFARLPLSNCEFFLFLACAQGEREDTEVKSMCIVRAMADAAVEAAIRYSGRMRHTFPAEPGAPTFGVLRATLAACGAISRGILLG